MSEVPQDSIDREAIQTLVVTAIADGIDAYEETGTFPPILGNRATDEILELVTAWHNTQLKATLRTIHKTIVDNDVAGPVKWQVEDMQSNLEK